MNETHEILQTELVKLWLKDEGKTEDRGQNRSDMCDAINKRLGVAMGEPYCIGGLLVRGVEPLCKRFMLRNPIPMAASTQTFWVHAVQTVPQFIHPKGDRALKGDICILVTRKDAGRGHAYGLTADEGAKQLTIEYNTNVAGSRNGDGVYQLTRTQDGTPSKEYRGAVDVISWILSANPNYKLPELY